MKIRVTTSKYDYMGLPYGLEVDVTGFMNEMGIYTVSFAHKGSHWLLERKDYSILEGDQPPAKIVKSDTVDMVNSPNHYILFNKSDIEGDTIEVKHVVKAILERWQSQESISFDFYQAGCYKELLQYLLRAPLKNNYEDVAKAKYYLEEILNEW